MKCVECGSELTEEMFENHICFSCGCPIAKSEEAFKAQQSKLKAAAELEAQKRQNEIKQKDLEAQRQYIDRLENHMLTTGFSFEGYHIDKYFGIVTGETIMGTGYFSDIGASIADFFGVEASEYSQKLHAAKQAVLNIMVKNSTDLGGNAIIGISYELMSFSGNMMGVSVTGTSVKIEKIGTVPPIDTIEIVRGKTGTD